MPLTLDPITVNTEIAEKYMEKYKNFDAWPAPGKFWSIEEYPDEKKEYSKEENYYSSFTNIMGSYTARKLVEKIKEHESTFYQLEYLIRKTDKADFQNYFLLMCQHLLCEDCWNLEKGDINIVMNENTPLYALGCAAAAKRFPLIFCIVTTQKMAPICHLFFELCTQVGWAAINLVFVNEINDFPDFTYGGAINVFEENSGCFECTGVVTESADIDSALDVFIDWSVTAPWKLQRIYVQESVYEEVQEALAARGRRRPEPGCGAAVRAGPRLFVCDALGDAAGLPLEPYRTARELAALLRAAGAGAALALWAADAAAALEAALAAPASLVWINQPPAFPGPPASSLPVYEPLYAGMQFRMNEASLRDLKKRWTAWKELTKNERIESIMKILRERSAVPEGYESFDDFYDDVLNVRDESFVSVDDGKICFGVERPPLFENFVHVLTTTEKSVVKSIIAAIDGKAVVYSNVTVPDPGNLWKALEKAGVPMISENFNAPLENLAKTRLIKKLKVIRSSFGTIFAN